MGKRWLVFPLYRSQEPMEDRIRWTQLIHDQSWMCPFAYIQNISVMEETLLRHSCCERRLWGHFKLHTFIICYVSLSQLQFLQHQMQPQQMGMAVGAAAQPRQHSANQPKSKRKRSTPQPLPKSWPPAGRQQTALCSIGSILRTDCGLTGLKLFLCS